MMERDLKRDPAKIEGYIDAFEEARTLARVPEKLDFGSHPALDGLPTHPKNWQLVAPVASMLYHTDLATGYRSLKETATTNDSKKRTFFFTIVLY